MSELNSPDNIVENKIQLKLVFLKKILISIAFFLLIITSFFAYQKQINLYFVLPIFALLYINKRIKKFWKTKLILTLLLIFLINFLYLIESLSFTSESYIGFGKALLNRSLADIVNLILFVFLFYVYYEDSIQNENSIIKSMKTNIGMKITTYITIGICLLGTFLLFQLPPLPILCIIPYSILLSYMIAKIFPKSDALLIVPAYLITLLLSVLFIVLAYFLLQINYIPQGRYFFTMAFFPYLYLQIALLISFILWFIPAKFYTQTNKYIKTKTILLFIIFISILYWKYIPIFSNFFDK